jgi:hypothetical protein
MKVGMHLRPSLSAARHTISPDWFQDGFTMKKAMLASRV